MSHGRGRTRAWLLSRSAHPPALGPRARRCCEVKATAGNLVDGKRKFVAACGFLHYTLFARPVAFNCRAEPRYAFLEPSQRLPHGQIRGSLQRSCIRITLARQSAEGTTARLMPASSSRPGRQVRVPATWPRFPTDPGKTPARSPQAVGGGQGLGRREVSASLQIDRPRPSRARLEVRTPRPRQRGGRSRITNLKRRRPHSVSAQHRAPGPGSQTEVARCHRRRRTSQITFSGAKAGTYRSNHTCAVRPARRQGCQLKVS